ncbi:ribonuclease 1 precursor, putative [Entamoeba dispar SAW760]|uniref:Ribonuclease 1, putative n=1 Tax=Entamoeba dispar (strain ATCC PRA-260 / SAW760) TaxID=370354 RepID=B0ETY0_ENTDS|nr:ribonuclease 1 precursor, putative [Entamoeba dispar SAW760]EDR22068.1 ribonuclease 1 precursor, putative [Entamoeba dispar SAW760]|eukprot:EDR22068.1 ribonuclease 1 precursor, putative [Entamoeba dispar SAW760]
MLFLFLFFITPILCYHSISSSICFNTSLPQKSTFAYFVQSWPGTFCMDQSCHSITPINEGFTIHGFWPQKTESTYPECCFTYWKNEEITQYVQTHEWLLMNLRFYWPGLKQCSFFNYEYLKHGTCIPSISHGEDGPQYFADIALSIANKTNAWKIMKEKGIKDDSITQYSKEYIRSLFKEIYGANPLLFCFGNFFDEFRLCSDIPSFNRRSHPKIFDCDSSFRYLETCNNSIIFPKFPYYKINSNCLY